MSLQAEDPTQNPSNGGTTQGKATRKFKGKTYHSDVASWSEGDVLGTKIAIFTFVQGTSVLENVVSFQYYYVNYSIQVFMVQLDDQPMGSHTAYMMMGRPTVQIHQQDLAN